MEQENITPTESDIVRIALESGIVINNPADEDTSNTESQTEESITDSTYKQEALDNANKFEALSKDTSSTLRFSSASWFEAIKDIKITLVGAGGIGSWTALLLSRLSPYKINIYDYDTIEPENLAGQLYSSRQIGLLKSAAISQILYYFTNNNHTTYMGLRGRLGDDIALFDIKNTHILITGLDNMSSRNTAFNIFTKKLDSQGDKTEFLIDGRLSADKLQIFCIHREDKQNLDLYNREYLFSDTEAEPTVCTYKQTSHMASMIASLISNIVIKCTLYIKSIEMGDYEGEVLNKPPFYTSYDSNKMILKTEY